MGQDLLIKITLTSQIMSAMIQADLDRVVENQEDYIKKAADIAQKIYSLYEGV